MLLSPRPKSRFCRLRHGENEVPLLRRAVLQDVLHVLVVLFVEGVEGAVEELVRRGAEPVRKVDEEAEGKLALAGFDHGHILVGNAQGIGELRLLDALLFAESFHPFPKSCVIHMIRALI